MRQTKELEEISGNLYAVNAYTILVTDLLELVVICATMAVIAFRHYKRVVRLPKSIAVQLLLMLVQSALYNVHNLELLARD